MTQPAAAKLYRCSVRNVAGWVKLGKDANDPAPLHDPAEMVSWAKRMMRRGEFSRGVPEGIRLAAAGRIIRSTPPKQPDEIEAEESEPSLDSGALTDFATVRETARAVFLWRKAQFEKALADDDQVNAGIIATEVERAANTLRALDRDAGKILVSQGSLVPVSEVRAEIDRLCAWMPSFMIAAIQTALRGHLPADECRVTAREIVNEIKGRITVSRFTDLSKAEGPPPSQEEIQAASTAFQSHP